jgi:hypothetical protein
MSEEQVLVKFDVPKAIYYDGKPNYLLDSHCTLTSQRLIVQGSRDGTRQIILTDVTGVGPQRGFLAGNTTVVQIGQWAALHLGAADRGQAADICRWLNNAMMPGAWSDPKTRENALTPTGSTGTRGEFSAAADWSPRPAAGPRNRFALIALVLGVLSVPLVSCGGGFLFGPAAMVLGLIRLRGTAEVGVGARAMATLGILFGLTGLSLSILRWATA